MEIKQDNDVLMIRFDGEKNYRKIGAEDAAKLYGHLQLQLDTRLGRWRDPENPNMVCYKARRGGVFIVDERSVDECSGDGSLWFQNQVSSFGYKNKRFHEKHDTAYRYFQAHPEEIDEEW